MKAGQGLKSSLIMLMFFWKRPAGDLHGHCWRPGARGQSVGDPDLGLHLPCAVDFVVAMENTSNPLCQLLHK